MQPRAPSARFVFPLNARPRAVCSRKRVMNGRDGSESIDNPEVGYGALVALAGQTGELPANVS